MDAPRLICAALDDNCMVIESPPKSSIDALHAYVRAKGENAMSFWMGEFNQLAQLKIIKDICRLPFDTCWFEAEETVHGECVIHGMLMTKQGEKSIKGFSFTRIRRDWWLNGTVEFEDFRQELYNFGSLDREGYVQVSNMNYLVVAFLSALHCTNVRLQEHAPDPKLQKARARRGKAPLFSYWTLQLNGKSERGEAQGGTHASPRLHLRRGHPRQYSPGKWTWVQAHVVGNGTAGMVHKDYRAGPALMAPALKGERANGVAA
jgi:hypothetical protein